MVTEIQTVLGPVGLDELGETMMHEHVFFWNWGEEHKRAASIAYARQELRKLAACGARTLVDVGPLPDRELAWYRELAPQVDLHIVLSTGFYLEDRTPEPFRSFSEDQCVARFRKELLDGIGATGVRATGVRAAGVRAAGVRAAGVRAAGVRAGLIKAASNKAELTGWERTVLRAAARVQRETGVPVCLHSCEGARSQFDRLVEAGADPERLYFSHVEAEFGWEGRTLKEQARYLEAICREGGSLFFNNYLFEFDTPHEDMMYLMHALADRGYLHRLLFGMDVNFGVADDGRIWMEAEREHPECAARTWETIYGGFIPLLKRWGFTDAEVHTMLVENPRALFGATRI
jgi:phosphotriesterase-related protein